MICKAMSKDYGKQEPERLWESNPGRPSRTIRLANPDGEGEDYEVEVPLAQWDYDHIVCYIVTKRYPNDRMQAIQNNFLKSLSGAAGEKGEEYLQEFNDMQAWRDLAKETAHQILGG